MNIELINWIRECKGRLIKIDFKINQKIKSMRIEDVELIKVFVANYTKYGITASNVVDFINDKDPKYKFEEKHKLFFLKEFFTI